RRLLDVLRQRRETGVALELFVGDVLGSVKDVRLLTDGDGGRVVRETRYGPELNLDLLFPERIRVEDVPLEQADVPGEGRTVVRSGDGPLGRVGVEPRSQEIVWVVVGDGDGSCGDIT